MRSRRWLGWTLIVLPAAVAAAGLSALATTVLNVTSPTAVAATSSAAIVAGPVHPVARASARTLPHQASAAPATATGRGVAAEPSAPAGNLEVTVPEVPAFGALSGLCAAFLGRAGGPHSEPGSELRVLVGATGGTTASTTAWCLRFLSRPAP